MRFSKYFSSFNRANFKRAIRRNLPISAGAAVSLSTLVFHHSASTAGAFSYHSPVSVPDLIENSIAATIKLQASFGNDVTAAGSGFFISEDGYFVTNDHVFRALEHSGTNEIQCLLDDGRCYRVQLVASDAYSDISVGRVIDAPPGTKFTYLRPGSSSELRRGDFVAVLGSPLGGSLAPSVGVLSGQKYISDDPGMNNVLGGRSDWCLLQVDAGMASGNSGGPIINDRGQVVGVSVMVQTSLVGVGYINFGVAIDQAWPIIQQLISKGSVTRARVGMSIEAINNATAALEARSSGMRVVPGLLVTSVNSGYPAQAAGILEGDVVVEIDGRKMVRNGDYFAALGPVYDPNKTLRCKIFRPSRTGGQEFEVLLKPTKREDGDDRSHIFKRRVRAWPQ
jgi:serine protease Do